MSRVIVGVAPAEALGRHARLFGLLEKLYSVAFRARSSIDGRNESAALLIGATRADATAIAHEGLPCLAVLGGSERVSPPCEHTVCFTDSPSVPQPFRGRVLVERNSSIATEPLVLQAGDDVIAERDSLPVWARRCAVEGSGTLDLAAAQLPDLGDESFLVDYFSREQFISLLPLLHFLQRICADGDWLPSSPRACIVFDDVNLRTRSYGCLDFGNLGDHALRKKYHAAIAMIPLDSSRVSAATAVRFCQLRRHLSLVIHGNNHQFIELARNRTEHSRIAELAQARRRMIDCSQRTGLSVCAVMEPPYGIIRSDYFTALDALGYEATLITPRQFRQWNTGRTEFRALGMASAEYVSEGLAVIPRITADTNWRTAIILARFLNQPVVIAGHHFDADGDLQAIGDVVDFVNGMGPVIWSDLSSIARSGFATRQEDGTLRVRVASRRSVVPVPPEAHEIVIERPWLDMSRKNELQWRYPATEHTGSAHTGDVFGPIPANGAPFLEVVSPAPHAIDPQRTPVPRTDSWLLVRRAMAELRDRSYARLPRKLRRKSLLTLP